jgi:DNA polymerase V
MGAGQVLMRPYSFAEAETIVKEMAVSLALDLHAKQYVTDSVSLLVNYDSGNDLSDYRGDVVSDYYGRNRVAKPAHGVVKFQEYTSSVTQIRSAVTEIYRQKTDPFLMVRRITVTAGHIIPASEAGKHQKVEVFDLFSDPEKNRQKSEEDEARKEKDLRLQDAMIKIRNKFGKNAVMTAVSARKEATGKERNEQIGGHKK